MFCFNGDFRRKPEQNLSGNSKNQDRQALIRNAQIERQKREIFRRQVQSSIKIQSQIRSYLARIKAKRAQKEVFDSFSKGCSGPLTEKQLEYLLIRLLFFYDKSDLADCQRLIALCQAIVKNPQLIFNQLAQQIWMHRLNRTLLLCIKQLFNSELSQAIPLRMLEIFTETENIVKYTGNPEAVRPILVNSFVFLVRNKFFVYMKRLLEERTPPLDGPTPHPPNPFCETVLRLIVRPLSLVSGLVHTNIDDLILASFVEELLSDKMSEPIQYLLLPYLNSYPMFPYIPILKCCDEQLLRQEQQQNHVVIDEDSPMDGSGVQTALPSSTSIRFSSYLLYSILKLDERHMSKLRGDSIVSYVHLIANMVVNIWKLPRKAIVAMETDEDYDSGEEEEGSRRKQETDVSETERRILQEIVSLLNERHRIDTLLDNVRLNQDNDQFVKCLCQICHVLMVFNRSAVYEYRLVYTLAFQPVFIRTLWHIISTMKKSATSNNFNCPLSLLSKGISVPETDSIIPLLSAFCAIFSRQISTLHDDEFFTETLTQHSGVKSMLMPFSIQELVALSAVLKDVCLGLVELAFPIETRAINEHYRSVFNHKPHRETATSKMADSVRVYLFKSCVFLLRQIYTRDLRRNFCPENHWTMANLNLPLDKPADLTLQRRRRGPRPFQPIRDFTREDLESGPPLSTKQMRSITILREIPFVVPFNDRVNILLGLLAADKLKSQGEFQNFLQGPSLNVKVRRTHLYEDSFEKLSLENEPDLRPKLKVQMVNAVGLDEAGVDGGGVFREFLSELIKTAFDPNRGFFMITTDNKLYPNPGVGKIVENYQTHYYFIGRILGKALYENLLVELPLADFFLSKLAGKHSDVDIHQLASLDPVLHKNLLSLKAYEGDVAELGLDFTVVCDELGETRVEELKPDGSNISVTSSNRIEYIQLMADYKLNRQIRKQCLAFREGLQNVLPIEWLYMFSNIELQVLISGAEVPVDIYDLRVNTKYSGNFSMEHQTVQMFWRVIERFDEKEKRLLLKFVTSCSRPPLLGFRELEPPFTIQDSMDTDRLPSASTCMNLLKLPPFKDEKLMYEKLLYAINSGTGFELS